MPPSLTRFRTMDELRPEIDRIDRELIVLLRARIDCIDRAAEIKAEHRLPARIEARVDKVLANVRAESVAAGVDPDLAAQLWEMLIEWSIAREERRLSAGDTGEKHERDTD